MKSKIQKLFNLESLRFKTKLFFIAFYYAIRHPRRFWNALSQRGKTWALRILIFILIVAIAVPVSLWYSSKKASAAWWNEDWAYRKAVTITNSTGSDLSDFQVSVTEDTATLITDGKMQNTCADIRFTNRNGQQLDYWIEENNPGCNDASTKIWVKAPNVYSGTDATTIYMYYGNPQASATQNGDETFEFFDDFNDGAIDPDKWTMSNQGEGGSYTETNGQLQLTSTNNQTGSANAQSVSTFTNDFVVEWRRYDNQQHYNDFSFGYGDIKGQEGTDWWHTNPQYGYTDLVQDNINFQYRKDGSASLERDIDGPDSGQWIKHKNIYSSSGSWTWFYDTGSGWTQLGTGQTDTDYLSNEKYLLWSRGGFSGAAYGGTSQIDNVFVHKYASTDPTTSASAEEIGPGPVAYWRFDEGQGSTAYDSTVNRNNGTISGAAWKPESDCLSGKCLSFDGMDDVVNFAADKGPISGTGPFTLQAWIRTNMTGEAYLLQQRDGGDYNGEYIFEINAGKVRYWDYNNGYGFQNFDSVSSINDNKWHQIIFVRNGTNGYIYIDGKLNNSMSATTINISSNLDFAIGYNLRDNNRFFSGSIDELKIYPYARTAAQIAQDYNAGLAGMGTSKGAAAAIGGESPKWMTDGLVGHWKMDETEGITVADASGNGNDGTLINAQETGTAQTGSDTTSATDPDNSSLSTTDDAYNNMIFRITGGTCGVSTGTERTIQDYTGSTRTFTFSALSASSEGCTFEIRHQTGGKFGNGVGLYSTNSGYTFTEGDDYIEVPSNSSLEIRNYITLSAWIKRDEGDGISSKILGKQRPGYNLGHYQLTSGSFGLYLDNLGYPDGFKGLSYTQPSKGVWHHVVATYDGDWQRVFVDGQEVASQQIGSHTIDSSSHGLGIGINLNLGSQAYSFRGVIDDTRIYNRALAPDEVKQLFEWGPGPVGYWKMDENVSGNNQTLVDSSGNGNNLTTGWGANASGMDCTKSGKYGGACEYDGLDDNAKSSSSAFNVRDAITLEAWVYPKNDQTTVGGIIGAGYYMMRVHQGDLNGQYQFSERIGGAWREVGTMYQTKNTWQHIAYTYDKGTRKMNIYKNGVQVGSSTLSGLEYYDMDVGYCNSGYMDVGGGVGACTGTSSAFKGLIDEAKIYNYARTPKQIVEDMNAGHPIGGSPMGSPVAHWKFDEGYGDTAYDSSQNSKDLTLSTASAWTTSGKFEKAFDGGDNRRAADNTDDNDLDFATTDDFALTGWVKSDSNPEATQYIIHKQTGNEGYAIYMEADGDIVFGIGDTSSTSFPEDTAGNVGRDFADGAWHHYAAVKTSNTRIDLYVDGELIGSDTSLAASETLANSAILYIGDANATDGTDEFLGEIDEVKIYRAALTPDQIALDMNQGKSTQFGGQTSATGATGAAAEYCVPGDTAQCDPPVGEWKFDEKTGGSVNDTSGNGNVGTWYGTGAHWGRGKYGSAGSFNGSDDYVDAGSGSSLDFSGNFTIEYWIKSTDQSWRTIIGKSNNYGNPAGGLGWGSYPRTVNNGIRTYFRDGVGNGVNVDIDNVLDGNWHFIYFSRQGSNITYGSDGKFSTSACTSNNFQANVPLWIGHGYQYHNGFLDNIRIFNYARTPAQIAWDYNRGKPVGWWKMNEGEGTTAYDSSGNGNHGTLTNMDPPNDWVDGKFEKALDFDGSDWVNVPYNSLMDKITQGISVSVWVKPTNDTVNQWIVSRDDYSSNRLWNLMFQNTNKVGFRVWTSTGNSAAFNNVNLDLGTWQHFLGTWDGSNVRLYKNGILVAGPTARDGTLLTSSSIGLGIARDLGTVEGYFQGQIDDVRVYNYALTAEQVKQVMNEGSVVRFGE